MRKLFNYLDNINLPFGVPAILSVKHGVSERTGRRRFVEYKKKHSILNKQ